MLDQTLIAIERRLNALERNTVQLRQGEITGGNELTVDLGSSAVDLEATVPGGTADPANGPHRVAALLSGNNPPMLLGSIGARVDRGGTDQTGIADSTETALSFTTERYDNGEFWDVASPTVFTVPVDGFYQMGASVEWDTNTTGYRRLSIRTGAFNVPLARTRATAISGLEQSVTTGYFLTAGETVSFSLFQTSGGARTIEADVLTALSSPSAFIVLVA